MRRVLLQLGPELRWVIVDGVHIRLQRRHAARGILRCLLEARQAGRVCGSRELIAAGWPEERLFNDYAHNRLWVTLSRMRKLGLAHALEHDGRGYRLVSEVEVQEVVALDAAA